MGGWMHFTHLLHIVTYMTDITAQRTTDFLLLACSGSSSLSGGFLSPSFILSFSVMEKKVEGWGKGLSIASSLFLTIRIRIDRYLGEELEKSAGSRMWIVSTNER